MSNDEKKSSDNNSNSEVTGATTRRNFVAIAGSLLAGLGLQQDAFAEKVARAAKTRQVGTTPPLIPFELMEGLSPEDQDLLVGRVVRTVLSNEDAQAILREISLEQYDQMMAEHA